MVVIQLVLGCGYILRKLDRPLRSMFVRRDHSNHIPNHLRLYDRHRMGKLDKGVTPIVYQCDFAFR